MLGKKYTPGGPTQKGKPQRGTRASLEPPQEKGARRAPGKGLLLSQEARSSFPEHCPRIPTGPPAPKIPVASFTISLPRLEGFLRAGEKGIGARGRPRHREQPGCQALRLFLQGGEGKNNPPQKPKGGREESSPPKRRRGSSLPTKQQKRCEGGDAQTKPQNQTSSARGGDAQRQPGPPGLPGAQTPPPGALPRWHELKESSRGLRYLSGKGKGRVRAQRGRGTPGRGVPRTESGTGTSVRLRGQP